MQINLKYIFLIVFVLTSFLWAQENNVEYTTNGAVIQFEKEKHDFGQIEEGKVVDYVFKFTNIGNDTLRIKRVDGG